MIWISRAFSTSRARTNAFSASGSSGSWSAVIAVSGSDHTRRHRATRLIHLVADQPACIGTRVRLNPSPVETFQQRRELRGRQSHDPVLHLRTAALAIFQPLGTKAAAGAIPEDQLDPVRPLRAEHVDRAAVERAGAHRLAHQRRQAFRALRKSTGFVAIITLTAPVRPITTLPSAHGSPPPPPGVGATADPHRNTVDLQLDHAGIPGGLPFPRLRRTL